MASITVAFVCVPPSRQKKPAAFRFRRGGENSISAASFFLSKPEPFHWVPVWLTNGGCRQTRLGEFFEPILFFLLQKEKNGFKLPRKERGQGAYRCPEFDSDDLRFKLSVAQVPTTRKVSALCALPFGGAAQQNQGFRADEGIGPYKRKGKMHKKQNRDPTKWSRF